ncbi:Nucleolar protein 6 [Cichlidogyrus casuarinus]|uniref:Nucleolar protein 6 n=1 Tax=Cichlidogyrus casuarinus TaxID=1844966 RepID=A0ABD2Q2N4_9PLAT
MHVFKNKVEEDGKLSKLLESLRYAFAERAFGIELVNLNTKKGLVQSIGIRLNEHILNSCLTKGPQSKTSGAVEFQHFWGKKSELRHIDGDLRECLAWDPNKDIPTQICSFVFKKLQLTIQYNTIQTNKLLKFCSHRLPYTFNSCVFEASDAYVTALNDRIKEYFLALNDKLPLDIRDVFCLSSSLRTLAALPPIALLPYPLTKRSVYSPPSSHPVHFIQPLYGLLT